MKNMFAHHEVGVEKDGFIVLAIEDVFEDKEFNARKELGRAGQNDYEMSDDELKASLLEHQTQRGEAYIEAPTVKRVIVKEEINEAGESKLIDKEVWGVRTGFRRVALCKEVLPKSLQRFKVLHPVTKNPEADLYADMVMNLVENEQRQSLRPWERAERFALLKKRFGKQPADIAKDCGLDRKYVGNLIRIREKACDEVWELFKTAGEQIPYMALFKIVMLAKDQQVEAFKTAQANGWAREDYTNGDGKGKKGKGKGKGGSGAGWSCVGGKQLYLIEKHAKKNGVKSLEDDKIRRVGDPYYEGFMQAIKIARDQLAYVIEEESDATEEAAE